MTTNEIKKALYKQKPIAQIVSGYKDGSIYTAEISTGRGGVNICQFTIPFNEMGDQCFGIKEPAQLLIRWLDTEV